VEFKLLGYADESWRVVTVIAGINKTMEVKYHCGSCRQVAGKLYDPEDK